MHHTDLLHEFASFIFTDLPIVIDVDLVKKFFSIFFINLSEPCLKESFNEITEFFSVNEAILI